MRHNRILVCLLAALLIAPSLIACSDSGSTETTADTTAAAETNADAETEDVDPFFASIRLPIASSSPTPARKPTKAR